MGRNIYSSANTVVIFVTSLLSAKPIFVSRGGGCAAFLSGIYPRNKRVKPHNYLSLVRQQIMSADVPEEDITKSNNSAAQTQHEANWTKGQFESVGRNTSSEGQLSWHLLIWKSACHRSTPYRYQLCPQHSSSVLILCTYILLSENSVIIWAAMVRGSLL